MNANYMRHLHPKGGVCFAMHDGIQAATLSHGSFRPKNLLNPSFSPSVHCLNSGLHNVSPPTSSPLLEGRSHLLTVDDVELTVFVLRTLESPLTTYWGRITLSMAHL